MKKLVSVLMISVLSAAVAFAAAESADSAYHQKRYQDAIKIYESQLEQGTSSDLYYNLGCCYYKMQDIPKAILCFERALVLDAANDDARSNLSFVRQKSKIEENEPGGVLENILKKWCGYALEQCLGFARRHHFCGDAPCHCRLHFYGQHFMAKSGLFRRRIAAGGIHSINGMRVLSARGGEKPPTSHCDATKCHAEQSATHAVGKRSGISAERWHQSVYRGFGGFQP